MKLLAVVAIAAASSLSFAPQDAAGVGRDHHLAVRQQRFMTSLKAGEFERAYEELLRGSPKGEKLELIKALAKDAETLVKSIGEVTDWDSHGIVWQEKHQAFGTAILCFEESPLYLYFTWYRKKDNARWILTNVWFDDKTDRYWAVRR